jgi:hypothetical protein
VDPNIGIEAPDGIRSAQDALAMIAAGASRVRAALWPSSANCGKRARLFWERLIRRSGRFLEAGGVRQQSAQLLAV